MNNNKNKQNTRKKNSQNPVNLFLNPVYNNSKPFIFTQYMDNTPTGTPNDDCTTTATERGQESASDDTSTDPSSKPPAKPGFHQPMPFNNRLKKIRPDLQSNRFKSQAGEVLSPSLSPLLLKPRQQIPVITITKRQRLLKLSIRKDMNNGKNSKKQDPSVLHKLKKPKESLNLPIELVSLCPLILLQLEVFSEHTNLTFSKLIERKKDSYNVLKNENKIPHSLHIKCELKTSPDYASNADFLQLKEDMQNEVTAFIQKGTRIMTQWANIQLKLITTDCCTALLDIAMKYLDGLSSYNGEKIGLPNWPPNTLKDVPLHCSFLNSTWKMAT
jgi:hypothetical protein